MRGDFTKVRNRVFVIALFRVAQFGPRPLMRRKLCFESYDIVGGLLSVVLPTEIE